MTDNKPEFAFRMYTKVLTIPSLIRRIKSGYLTMHTYRDDDSVLFDASTYIESLIMGLIVPPIYLKKNNSSSHFVIDGVRRLKALEAFVSGSMKLEGLKGRYDLNGKTFDELDNDDKDKLNYCHLQLVEVDADEEMLKDIHRRLNITMEG